MLVEDGGSSTVAQLKDLLQSALLLLDLSWGFVWLLMLVIVGLFLTKACLKSCNGYLVLMICLINILRRKWSVKYRLLLLYKGFHGGRFCRYGRFMHRLRCVCQFFRHLLCQEIALDEVSISAGDLHRSSKLHHQRSGLLCDVVWAVRVVVTATRRLDWLSFVCTDGFLGRVAILRLFHLDKWVAHEL